MADEIVVWAPQAGPQKAFLDCGVYEIFYGGAKGGGKTDGVLGKYRHKAELYGSGFNAIFFRKHYPNLDDAIARSIEIFGRSGCQYNKQEKQWRFPGGGRLRFRHIETIEDATEYQGQSLSDICVEEAGEFPDESVIKRLHGYLRSAKGVPTQFILTGNPGGAGQAWLKKRYIDPYPAGNRIITEELENLPGLPPIKRSRVFIPSTLKDNKILMANDPNYVGNLRLAGSKGLVDAWLFGSWDGNYGMFFSEFSKELHVIHPCQIKPHWKKYAALDWGYRPDPWVCLWFAVDEFGTEYLYREAHGNEMTPEQVAERLKMLSADDDNFILRTADPSMWANKDGVSSAERMILEGWPIVPGHNDRANGAMRIREVLKGERLKIFNTCIKTIEAMENMVHDEKDPMKYGDHPLDHWVDPIRYHLMARPSRSHAQKQQIPWNSFENLNARLVVA